MQDQYTYNEFVNPANWFKVGVDLNRDDYIYKEYTIRSGDGEVLLNFVGVGKGWAEHPSFRHAMQAAFKHADSLGPLTNGEIK